MITVETKFIGLLRTEISNLESYFDDIVAQKEPELLEQWFGYELAKDISAAIPSTEAQALIDGFEYTDDDGYLKKITGLDDILPYFIYFYLVRDKQRTDSMVGNVSELAENSERSSPTNNVVNNYNTGVKYINEMICWLTDNEDTYTTFDFNGYNRTINIFGI